MLCSALDPSGYHEHATTITEQISTSRSNLISWGAAATDRTREIAILLQFLAIGPDFVRKGCAGRFANRNFTSVSGDRASFRAKGLRRTLCKSQFYRSFSRPNLVSCEKVATGRFANRNFTSAFGDRTSFRAKGLRFLPSRWHCPAPSREK